MAWFKDTDGSEVPMVTLERIHLALGELGFAMSPTDAPGKLTAQFNDHPFILDVSNPIFLVVRARHHLTFPANAMGDLMEAANDWNARTLWGMAIPLLTADGSAIAMHVDVVCPIACGLDDQQLVAAIKLGLHCCLECLDSFGPQQETESDDADGPAEAKG